MKSREKYASRKRKTAVIDIGGISGRMTTVHAHILCPDPMESLPLSGKSMARKEAKPPARSDGHSDGISRSLSI